LSRHCANQDRFVAPVLSVLAGLTLLLLALIMLFLLKESWPVIASGHWRHFFTDPAWYPLEGQFGLLPMIIATLVAAAGAILLAAPLGIVSAIFEVFFAPPALARIYHLAIALLAGIPSVVFGLWSLTVLVPLIGTWQPPGASLLAAILVLTLMILPTVALTSSAALSRTPLPWLHGAAALGFSRRTKIIAIAIPAARGGISGGILLAIARALGETMAVLMVAGNVVRFPTELFAPVRVLTANIALEMAYATGQHRAGLFVSGLLLTLLVLCLAGLALRMNREVRYA